MRRRHDPLLPAPPRSPEQVAAARQECRQLVLRRAGLSAGAAALPIPGLDVVTDVAVLAEMIDHINRRFGLSPEQIDALDPRMQQLVLLAITRSGNLLVGKLVSTQLIVTALKSVGVRIAGKTAARYVPVIGTATSAVLGFSTLRWLGNRHIEACVEIVSGTFGAETGRGAA